MSISKLINVNFSDGTMTVSSSSTFYISSKSIIADGVLDFSVVDDFYFYAKKVGKMILYT